MARLPTKQVIIHLQLTKNEDRRELVLYAEAATDTGQRCMVTGPWNPKAEGDSISDILKQVGLVVSERVTFGTQAIGDRLIDILT